ncbi:MAG: hypothetical protein U7127_11240 [Phormidium sp.]
MPLLGLKIFHHLYNHQSVRPGKLSQGRLTFDRDRLAFCEQIAFRPLLKYAIATSPNGFFPSDRYTDPSQLLLSSGLWIFCNKMLKYGSDFFQLYQIFMMILFATF